MDIFEVWLIKFADILNEVDGENIDQRFLTEKLENECICN